MEFTHASHIDAAARPAVVTEQALSADTLRRRGAVLAGEALVDWPALVPAARGLVVSGLPGTLVTFDGLRLAPAANGFVDLALLPLAMIDGARLTAGTNGAAQGAGSLAGSIDLRMAGENRLLAGAGAQAGRGIGLVDLRLGGAGGWLGGGFTQGGAVPGAAGLAASAQSRWHVAGRFDQTVGQVAIWGRGLFASRHDGGRRSDWHDAALGISGGTRWQWRLAAARGGQDDGALSSTLAQARAVVSGATGLTLPAAAEPISLAAGAEWRRLRLGGAVLHARELFAEAALPLVQDRPAAENLIATLGVRQAWLAGRSEILWQAGGRWEAFPGIVLRGQAGRGIDDAARVSGTSQSVGLIATPAFVPGLALTLDRRWQSAGPARIQAVDVSATWRGRVGADAQLALTALATHHDRAELTPLPVPRFSGLFRATLETGPWAVSAGVRHRAGQYGGLDASLERQIGDRLRLVASVSNAGGVGRQGLLQLVAGF